MWKHIVETDGPQMTIRGMRIACWTHKATDIPSANVIIIAFLLQQWSHDRESMLRHKYIVFLVDKYGAVSPSADVR
jgi:hypothetical protein